MSKPTQADTSTTGKHIPALDGLRGIAILMVMMLHMLWSNNNPAGGWLVRFFARFVSCGSLGVDLFFALSGFLITGILYDTLKSSHFFRNFYARRTLRVFPLYYAFLALLIVLSVALGSHVYKGIIGLLTYGIINPHGPVWGARWINTNHFWSLAIEEQFYLCWPLAVFALRTRHRIAIAAIVIALASVALRVYLFWSGMLHTNPYLAYSWTPARLDGLLLGSALAMATRSSFRDAVLKKAPAVFAVGILLLTAYAIAHGELDEVSDPVMQTVGIFGAAILSCAAIAASLRAGSLFARSMESRWLRFFGKYSYGLYVIHYTIITSLLSLRPWIAGLAHSKLTGVLGTFVVALCASVAASVLSFRYFEQPILTLKRHFQDDSPTAKLRRQLNAAPPAA